MGDLTIEEIYDFDDEDEDFDDDLLDNEELCGECDDLAIDECECCGKPLCVMHMEIGANFCSECPKPGWEPDYGPK